MFQLSKYMTYIHGKFSCFIFRCYVLAQMMLWNIDSESGQKLLSKIAISSLITCVKCHGYNPSGEICFLECLTSAV